MNNRIFYQKECILKIKAHIKTKGVEKDILKGKRKDIQRKNNQRKEGVAILISGQAESEQGKLSGIWRVLHNDKGINFSSR